MNMSSAHFAGMRFRIGCRQSGEIHPQHQREHPNTTPGLDGEDPGMALRSEVHRENWLAGGGR
jgi:hypothetical protein